MSYRSEEEPLEQLYLMRSQWSTLTDGFGLFLWGCSGACEWKEACCLKEVLVKGHLHDSWVVPNSSAEGANSPRVKASRCVLKSEEGIISFVIFNKKGAARFMLADSG